MNCSPSLKKKATSSAPYPEATPTMAARYSTQWSICTLSMTTGTYTSSAVPNGRISSLENGTPHAEVMLTWANTSKTPYAER